MSSHKPTPAPPVTRIQSKNLFKQSNINQFLKEYSELKTNDERRLKLIKIINQNNQLIDIHIRDTELLAENNRMLNVAGKKLKRYKTHLKDAEESTRLATSETQRYKDKFYKANHRVNTFTRGFAILCFFLTIAFIVYLFIYPMGKIE